MTNAMYFSLHLLKDMNRRVLVGGGGLTLLVLGQGAISLIGPFA